MKQKIEITKFTFRLNAIEKFAIFLDQFGQFQFSKYYNHALREEEKNWPTTGIIDITGDNNVQSEVLYDKVASSSAAESELIVIVKRDF